VPLIEREANINALLLEAFSIFDLKAKQKKLALHLKKALPDGLARVTIDDVKLMKVIDNLLENAIKFTNQGFVEFGYTTGGNILEFYVKDTGIGIRPEMKELIFERFSQEEKALSQKAGGLGLGLSIAKANTELMGGSIRVGSEKGKGSTFYVRIPFQPIDPEAVEEWLRNREDDAKNSPLVLVVEDDEVNYQYLEVLLHKFNTSMEVLHAVDGESALEICEQHPDIKLVLMDVKMKTMSGLEATKIIKRNYPHLPVVVQSAYVTQADEKLAREAGCDAFLAKPIASEDFFSVLQSVLNG
jgi:CheY-like chemotaxis protein